MKRKRPCRRPPPLATWWTSRSRRAVSRSLRRSAVGGSRTAAGRSHVVGAGGPAAGGTHRAADGAAGGLESDAQGCRPKLGTGIWLIASTVLGVQGLVLSIVGDTIPMVPPPALPVLPPPLPPPPPLLLLLAAAIPEAAAAVMPEFKGGCNHSAIFDLVGRMQTARTTQRVNRTLRRRCNGEI